MQETAVHVVSLHDKKDGVLSFDLKDVLHALRERVGNWVWCVTDLDCPGPDGGAVCQAVANSAGSGVWMSSQELVRLAERVHQTVGGEFLAFPKDTDKQSLGAADLELGAFPAGKAELAVRAIDSSLFEIYAKDPAIPDLLRRHFQDVRTEDPSLYFAHL